MSAKKRKILLGIFLLAVLFGWSAGQYDYSRLVAGKRPVFALFILHLQDGGSIQYLGPGYTVTDEHQMRWGVEMQPDKTNVGAPFRVGPRLDYWTPFFSREQTKFVVETNK